MATPNLLIYLLRRDVRLDDNPIFHAIATDASKTYTHLLPVYVFPAQHIEVSGFIPKGREKENPYPEARTKIGNFWKCGPHRAKFIAESVWDLKEVLEGVGSGLEMRVGMIEDVLESLLEGLLKRNGEEPMNVGGVWMTGEESPDEKKEEKHCERVCEARGVGFKLWKDEKYLVDDDDVRFKDPQDLPDVFTTYRKLAEPLRDVPRAVLPTPTKGSLPPLPISSIIPPQASPFNIPTTYNDLESAILSPIPLSSLLSNPPIFPKDTVSAHPFNGGSRNAHHRLDHLLKSGALTTYKATRNGLLGEAFSTKLSAYHSQGCITARQIHAALLQFEDGSAEISSECQDAGGFGQGETEGTKAVRYELLWRDYMRLCTRKFGERLFSIGGFRQDFSFPWKAPGPEHPETAGLLRRFLEGTTGMGLIDASQRELFLTGYTSNRARQNVASFLAKHLGVDWRIGSEWYTCMLVDYDVNSNWGNWQYVSGVGNDPRGEARSFNPVKQAWDYDPRGEFCWSWIVELQGKEVRSVLVGAEGTAMAESEAEGRVELTPGDCFQAWTMDKEKQEKLGIAELEWVTKPLKPIEFTIGRKQGARGRPYAKRGERAGYRGEGRGDRGVHRGRMVGGGGEFGGGRGWSARGFEARRGGGPRGRGGGRWGGGGGRRVMGGAPAGVAVGGPVVDVAPAGVKQGGEPAGEQS